MAVTLGDAVFYLRVNESELNAKLSAAEAKAREFAAKMQTAFDNVGKNASFSGISQGIDGLASKAASSATKLDSLKAAMDKAQVAANNADVAFKNQKANLAILEGQLNTAKTKYAEIADKLEAAKNATNKNEDAIKKLSAEYDRAGKAVDAKQMALNNLNTKLTATESKLNTANTALNTAKDRYKTAGDAAATAATQKEKTAKSAEHVGTATGNARGGLDKMRDGLKGVENQAHTTEGALQKIVNGGLAKIGALGVEGFGKMVTGLVRYGSEALDAVAKNERLEFSLRQLTAQEIYEAGQKEKLVLVGHKQVASLEKEGAATELTTKAKKEHEKQQKALNVAIEKSETAQARIPGVLHQIRDAELKLSEAKKGKKESDAAYNERLNGYRANLVRYKETLGDLQKTVSDGSAAQNKATESHASSAKAAGALVPVYKTVKEETVSWSDAQVLAAKKSKELLGWIEKLAIQSPFNKEDVAKAFQLAKSYGLTTEEAQKLTTATINVSSAFGKEGWEMSRINLALGQMMVKNKLTGEETLQLTEAGINMRKMLIDSGKVIGLTTENWDDYQKKGLIPARAAFEAYVEYSEKNFKTAAKDQSSSLSGLVASLTDLKRITLEDFFGGMFRAAQPYLDKFVNALQDPNVRNSIKQIGDGIGVFVASALEKAVAIGSKFVGFFNDLSKGAAAFKDPLEGLRLALMRVFGAENITAINTGIDFLKRLRDTISTLPATFAPLTAAVERLFNQVMPVATANSAVKFDAFKTAVDTAIKLATDIITAFEPVVTAIFGAVSTFLENHGADIVKFLGSAWDKIGGIVKDIGEVVSKAVSLYFGFVASFIKSNSAEIEVILFTVWNAIKILIKGTLDIISGIVQTALKLLKGDWKGAWEEVKQIFSTIVLAISDLVILFLGNLVQAVKNFRSAGSKVWHEALDEFEFIIRKGLIRAKTLVNQILDDILGVVKGFVGQFSDAGANMIEGFIGGIKSKAGALLDAARSVISGAIGMVRRTLDERSPSRVLFASGSNAIQGFINGVLGKSGTLNDAMKGTIASATKVLIGEGASWGEISKSVTATISEIRAKAKAEFDATHQITKSTTKAQRAEIEAEWKVISKTIDEQGENIRNTAKAQWAAMQADQKAGATAIRNDQKDIWGDIADMIGEFTDEIRKSTLQEGFEEIRDFGSKFTRELADDTSDVWRELSAAVNEKAKEMRDAVKGGSAEQRAAVEADIKAMRADVQAKWREMGRDVRDASKEVRDTVAEAYRDMREDVADKLDIIKKTAQREWDAAKDAATKAIAEAKKNNITDFTAIEAALKEKGEAIYDNAQRAYTNLRDESKRKLDEFKQNNQGAWDDVKKITTDTVRDILTEVVGGFDGMEKGSNSAIARLVNGVQTGMDAVKTSAHGAAEAVKTETQNIINAVVPVMTTLEELWKYVPGAIGGIDGRTPTLSQSWTDSFINQPTGKTTTPAPTAGPTPIQQRPNIPQAQWTFDPLAGVWTDGRGNTRPYEDDPNRNKPNKLEGSGPYADRPEFATGGIASGPSSGYPATLHGTEAVVPLPGGRAIPVEIRGGMGDNSAAVVRAIEIMTTVLERAIKSSGGNISITTGGKSSGFSMADITRSGQGVRAI